MAKGGEVAYLLQLLTMSRPWLFGTVIYTKWPTPWSRPIRERQTRLEAWVRSGRRCQWGREHFDISRYGMG